MIRLKIHKKNTKIHKGEYLFLFIFDYENSLHKPFNNN